MKDAETFYVQRCEMLETALKPFVKILREKEASMFCDGGKYHNADTVQAYINIGDLRRAARCLTPSP